MLRMTKLSLAAALPAALLSLAALAQSATAPVAAGSHPGAFEHLLKKLDTDGDGKISLAEFQAAAAARFKAVDTKNSGSVDAAQLAASPQAQARNLHVANRMVHRLDTAKKGYLTQDDFVAAAQQRFAKLDAQGTGKLTQAQFGADADSATSAGAPRAMRRGKFAQAEFAKLDSNGDGVVTKDEYVAAAKARFAALDTQRTGKVTAQQIATSATAQARDLRVAEHEVKKIGSNGVITKAQYLDAAQAHFAKLDKNGDGYISADEMPAGRWAQHKAGAGKS